MARGLDLRKQMKRDYPTQLVALVLEEHEDYNTGVLDTPNAIIKYDILVWTEDYGLIFEKSGKTSKEKLEETFTFEAPLDTNHNLYLDMTVIVNGKEYPFLTISQDDIILKKLRDVGVNDIKDSSNFDVMIPKRVMDLDAEAVKARANYVVDPTLTDLENAAGAEAAEQAAISAAILNNEKTLTEKESYLMEYEDGGHLDIFISVINQSVINGLISENFEIGKIPMDVMPEISNVDDLELQAKLLNKRITIAKKQTFGHLFSTHEETMILDSMSKEKLFYDLMNLLKGYETSGLNNLSDYRLSVYNTLKLAVENLIILKGKLENINNKGKVAQGAAK